MERLIDIRMHLGSRSRYLKGCNARISQEETNAVLGSCNLSRLAPFCPYKRGFWTNQGYPGTRSSSMALGAYSKSSSELSRSLTRLSRSFTRLSRALTRDSRAPRRPTSSSEPESAPRA